MKSTITFLVATMLSTQVMGNSVENSDMWANPLRVTTYFVDADECCLETRMIVEHFDGVNWMLAGQGTVYVNAVGLKPCSKTGLQREGSDLVIFEGYQNDNNLRLAIDGAIQDFAININPNKKRKHKESGDLNMTVSINLEENYGRVFVEGVSNNRTDVNFEIYDLTGKRVFYDERCIMQNGIILFTTKYFSAGTYTVWVKIDKRILKSTFVME